MCVSGSLLTVLHVYLIEKLLKLIVLSITPNHAQKRRKSAFRAFSNFSMNVIDQMTQSFFTCFRLTFNRSTRLSYREIAETYRSLNNAIPCPKTTKIGLSHNFKLLVEGNKPYD